MANTKKAAVKVSSVQEFIDEEDLTKSYYNKDGYLPQHEEAYTTIAVIRLDSGEWVMRQTDIINNQVVHQIDSKPNARAVVFEYFKMAAADLYYKEVY